MWRRGALTRGRQLTRCVSGRARGVAYGRSGWASTKPFSTLVLTADVLYAEEQQTRQRSEALSQRRELSEMAVAEAQAREYNTWLADQWSLREQEGMRRTDLEAEAERRRTQKRGSNVRRTQQQMVTPAARFFRQKMAL